MPHSSGDRPRHASPYIQDPRAGGRRRISPEEDPRDRKARRAYQPRPGYDDYEDLTPRRSKSYRATQRYREDSESPSPSPPRHHHRREPRPRRHGDYYEEAYPPPKRDPYRRERPRDDRYDRQDAGYFSDNRHDRRKADRYPDDPRPARDRYKDEGTRRGHSKPPKKGGKWQREATDMFKQHAVPVIKAEGGKLIAKELGKLIASQGR